MRITLAKILARDRSLAVAVPNSAPFAGTSGPRMTRSRADASRSFAAHPPLAKGRLTSPGESLSVKLTVALVECREEGRGWEASERPALGPWMRHKTGFGREKRRAVSTILATVTTVVVAIVASVAVSGFVFGALFQSSNGVRVVVIAESLPASAFMAGGSTTTFTCATSSSGAFLSLTNSGSGRGTVAGVTITWAGNDNPFSVSGVCAVGASGSSTATFHLLFPATTKITPSAVAGQPFSGTVTLSNGAQILFTGSWG